MFLLLTICALLLNPPAASLTVRWSPSGGEHSEKLSLLPVDIAVPEGATRAEWIERWTRSITGSEQRWDALPTGTYRIVLRSTTEPVSAPPPLDLGEVVLAPGDDRKVTVTLPSSQANNTASIQLRVSGAAKDASVTQWRNGVRSSLSPRVKPGLLDVTAPCAAGSILVIEAPDAIGSVVLDGNCDTPRAVTLVPRANLIARVAVPAGVQPPKSGSLRCPGKNHSETPFAIIDSRVQAAVPASCEQMTFLANGFAPVTLPSLDAGTIALAQGAAAAFRIRSTATGDLLEGVRITAVRARDVPALRNDREIESAVLAAGITNATGWVRLSGLPGERLVFFLRGPGRKQAQVSEPYTFRPGTETIVDDLSLELAANLYVTVERSVALEKSLELTAVEILPRGHNHWPRLLPISGILTPTGAVIEDVPPGTWDVSATGRVKNGFAIRAATKPVEVVNGGDQHVTLTIRDNLYKGRVTRNGSPVAGTINLTPVDRHAAHRTAVARIGSDGKFQVLLEDGGQYSVLLQDSSSRAMAGLGHYIEFRDPDGEVEIELPSLRIRGRVIDSAGNPVSDASVSAKQQITEPAAFSGAGAEADGHFVIESVAAGTWDVVASTKTAQSEPVVVSIDSSDVDDVILRLDPIRIVKVRLTDITGAPVRQAFVNPFIQQPGSPTPKGDPEITNSDGVAEFRVTSAQQAVPINLVFATPDLHVSCAVTRMDSDQSFTLPPSFGELRLAGRDWETARSTQPWLLSSTGCAVPFWGTRFDGDVAVFPGLAAGRWSLIDVRTPREFELLLTGRGANLSAIQSFTVTRGKVTRVSLPR